MAEASGGDAGGLGGTAAQLAALRQAVAEAEAEAIAGARLGELADQLKVLGAKAARLRRRRVAIEAEEAELRAQVGELRSERGRRVAELMSLGAPAALVAQAARLSLGRVRSLGEEAKGERAEPPGPSSSSSPGPAP